MRTGIGHLACVWIVALSSATALVIAGQNDLRLVTAAAEQDSLAVRALLNEGVDVNAARAD